MNEPKKLGRPAVARPRKHKVQVCFDDEVIKDVMAAFLQAQARQVELQPKERIAPSRLLSDLVAIAVRDPQLVERVAGDYCSAVIARKARQAA